MTKRINIQELEPDAYKALYPLEKYLSAAKLSPVHKVLIQIRASQINGCAYCINMHTKEAKKLNVPEQHIYALSAWRDTPFFTDEEQAILALTEEITLITQRVSDETYNQAAKLLEEHYLAAVIMAAIAINAWNRISISTRMMPSAD
ncbi:MAG: carboxymuconolactone decarboxylase family protein [Bacteroidota bacterium]